MNPGPRHSLFTRQNPTIFRPPNFLTVPRLPAKTPRLPKTARFAAIEALCRMSLAPTSVKPLFEKITVECRLTTDDRALAMNIIYGILRQRQYLELLMSRLSRHPLAKLDPFVRHALEVGLYQLFFLDRVPESAAVNETVNALKAARIPIRLHGFVNGILREAIRQKNTLPEPGNGMDGRPCLNHPEWLTDRWRRHFGEEEMRRICAANSCEPLLVLRVNTSMIEREAFRGLLLQQGIGSRIGSYAPEAVVLPDYQGAITLLPGYDQGFFQVQDEAAQLASLLLGPFVPGGRYLDACAGLGGKTSHLVQLGAKHNLAIIAIEPEPYRFQKLGENLRRLAPETTATTEMTSLRDFTGSCSSSFHGILVDAPCSGTGVTGRHPDIRWNRREEDFLRYQAEQLELLEQAAGIVTADGLLVYATCSLEPEENILVIRKFLIEHDNFQLTDPSPLMPPEARHLVVDGIFSPRPDATIDGFFAARLQRR